MADITFNSPSYVGKKAKGFIADLLLDGATIAGGLIAVHPNVKYKEKIQDITTDAVFQADADAFNAQGTTEVSEHELVPKRIKVQDEIGVETLMTSWNTEQMRAGANNNELPNDMGDFLVTRKSSLISIQIDELIWLGDTTLVSNNVRKWHDGLLKKAKADSAVKKLSTSTGELTPTGITVGSTTVITVTATNLFPGDYVYAKSFTGADAADINSSSTGEQYLVLDKTATTITIELDTTGLTITTGASTRLQFINKTNVIAYLSSHMNLTNQKYRKQKDWNFYVHDHIARAYIDAVGALNAAAIANSYADETGLVFNKKRINVMPYFEPNMIFSSPVGNLWFGTDLLADFNEIWTKFMGDVTGDRKYRYSARFASSVNFGFGTQITLTYPH